MATWTENPPNYGKLKEVPDDHIAFKFPLNGYSLGAGLFNTLAQHDKITIKTKDAAFSLLSQIAQLIVQQTPPGKSASTATLEVLPAPKRLEVSLLLGQPLSAPVTRQLQQLHPAIAIKSAKKKISFNLPARL